MAKYIGFNSDFVEDLNAPNWRYKPTERHNVWHDNVSFSPQTHTSTSEEEEEELKTIKEWQHELFRNKGLVSCSFCAG